MFNMNSACLIDLKITVFIIHYNIRFEHIQYFQKTIISHMNGGRGNDQEGYGCKAQCETGIYDVCS